MVTSSFKIKVPIANIKQPVPFYIGRPFHLSEWDVAN